MEYKIIFSLLIQIAITTSSFLSNKTKNSYQMIKIDSISNNLTSPFQDPVQINDNSIILFKNIYDDIEVFSFNKNISISSFNLFEESFMVIDQKTFTFTNFTDSIYFCDVEIGSCVEFFSFENKKIELYPLLRISQDLVLFSDINTRNIYIFSISKKTIVNEFYLEYGYGDVVKLSDELFTMTNNDNIIWIVSIIEKKIIKTFEFPTSISKINFVNNETLLVILDGINDINYCYLSNQECEAVLKLNYSFAITQISDQNFAILPLNYENYADNNQIIIWSAKSKLVKNYLIVDKDDLIVRIFKVEDGLFSTISTDNSVKLWSVKSPNYLAFFKFGSVQPYYVNGIGNNRISVLTFDSTIEILSFKN